MADFLRPEAKATLWRWREVLAGLALIVTGVWWTLGGIGVAKIVGWALAGLGIAAIVTGVQRMRFAQGGGGAGVVSLKERQVAYMGPLDGGVVDLDDLIELELDGTAKPAHWRLTTLGKHLAIPVNAEGADGLFDAFAALPGIKTERMLDILGRAPQSRVTVWEKDADKPAAPRLLH